MGQRARRIKRAGHRAREPGGPESKEDQSQECQRARRVREPGGPESQESQRARKPGGPGARWYASWRWNSNSLEKYPAAEPSPNKNERTANRGGKLKQVLP